MKRRFLGAFLLLSLLIVGCEEKYLSDGPAGDGRHLEDDCVEEINKCYEPLDTKGIQTHIQAEDVGESIKVDYSLENTDEGTYLLEFNGEHTLKYELYNQDGELIEKGWQGAPIDESNKELQLKESEGIVYSFDLYDLQTGNYKLNVSLGVINNKTLEETVEFHFELPIHVLELTDEELSVYEEFSRTLDESLLKGLTPLSIFKFHLKATNNREWETVYGLFIQDNKYGTPDKQAYIYELEQSPSVTNVFEEVQILLDYGHELIVNQVAENHINIEIVKDTEVTFGFMILKDSNGIWKMNWMPMQ